MSSAIGQTLGKDEFLKLFTCQLKYQDPLKPLESTEFTSQLAQFSQLEQLYNMNTSLQGIMGDQKSLYDAATAGLIGRHVKMQDGTGGLITGVSFIDGNATLVLDDNTNIVLNDVKEIY